MMKILTGVLLVYLLLVVTVESWTTSSGCRVTCFKSRPVVLPSRFAPPSCSSCHRPKTKTTALHSVSPILDSSILLAEESWRQYVPLVVSGFVILDILLGSPFVNLILAPMKRQTDLAEQDGSDAAVGDTGTAAGEEGGSVLSSLFGGSNPLQEGLPKVKDRKERIDSEQVAQEALDRARSSMELRDYLDRNKSDWDRIQDVNKQLDAQTKQLEENMEELEENLEM